MEKKKIALLFVCLGNIRRSPAAEGVMKQLVKNKGLEEQFEVDSAGIGGWHAGQLPDSRMRQRGALRGFNFNSRARQFSPDDFNRFDYIFVMDNENYRAITALARTENDKQKVRMLADYITTYKNANTIPDPYYGDERDFDYALDLIEDAVSGLLKIYENEE